MEKGNNQSLKRDWKMGDPCIFEMEPGSVEHINGQGDVVQVKRGTGRVMGYRLKVFPATEENIEVARWFYSQWMDVLARFSRFNTRNIFMYLCRKCEQAITTPLEERTAKMDVEFFMKRLEEISKLTCDGVHLF